MQPRFIVVLFIHLASIVVGHTLNSRNSLLVRQEVRSSHSVAPVSLSAASECSAGKTSDATMVASLADPDGKPCNFMPRGQCTSVLGDASIGEHGLCNTAELKQAFNDGTCLVYGVGIADNWEFEKAMARHGCEVHAFDPTIAKPPTEEPSLTNLHFHRWGLSGVTERNGTHQVRGTLDGSKTTVQPMFTLADMMKELGHTGRKLTVFKVDCEGCEWNSLSVIPTELWSRIGQLSLELHFSDGLMLDSAEQVHKAAKVATALQSAGFTKWRPDIREGWPWHRHLLPELLAAGMPNGFCCRLAGFYRENAI